MKKGKILSACQGVISILLALILMPVLSVVTMIVESSRIQSAQESLGQLMQMAGMSTLASYDQKLHTRFGLLGTTQQGDMVDIYGAYLQKNAQDNALLELGDISVSGAMPLGDADALIRQISEYEKLRMPTGWAFDFAGMGIDKLIGQFGDAGSFAEDALGATKDLTDAAVAAKELAEAGEAYEEAFNNLYEAYGNLMPSYRKYVSAVNALSQFLRSNDPPPTDPGPPPSSSASDYEDAKEAYDKEKAAWDKYNDEKKSLEDALSTAKTAYSDALYEFSKPTDSLIDKFIAAHNTLNTKKEALVKTLGDVAGSAEDAVNSYDDWQSDEPDSSLGKSDFDSGADVMQEMANTAVKLLDNFNEAHLRAKKSAFAAARTAVDTLTVTKSTPTIVEATDATYQVPWAELEVARGDLKTFMDLLNEEKETDDFFDMMTCFFDGLKALFDLTAIYDPELGYSLSSGMNMPYAGGPNVSAQTMSNGWNRMSTAWDEFSQTEGGLMKFVAFLKGIGNLLLGLAEFLASFIALLGERVLSIVQLGINIGKGDFARNLFLSDYIQNTLGSRASRASSAYLPAPISVSSIVTGNPMTEEYPAEGTGTGNIAFAACEQEYILYQSSSEILNQTLAFFDIFIVRAMTNIATVFTAKGVMSLIDAIPFPGVAPAIKVLLVIIEALVDTLFIVNGESVGFVKESMWFNIDASSPLAIKSIGDVGLSGGDSLLGKIQSLMEKKVSKWLLYNPAFDPLKADIEAMEKRKAEEEKIKKENKDSSSSSPGLSIRKLLAFKTKYDFYMWLFALCLDYDVLNGRLRNVIYMEMNYYYMNTTGIGYDLNKAYTQIDATVTASLDPIFILPDALKSFTTTQTLGY